MPTLRPGQNLVPRWRTRILPASTASPPYFLTPRRRPSESRPLREEPPDFLCAMVQISETIRLGLGSLRFCGRFLGWRLVSGGFLGGGDLHRRRLGGGFLSRRSGLGFRLGRFGQGFRRGFGLGRGGLLGGR